MIVNVKFDTATLEKIEEICNESFCSECPFAVPDQGYEGRVVECYLVNADRKPPYTGWAYEEDRMEDDLK